MTAHTANEHIRRSLSGRRGASASDGDWVGRVFRADRKCGEWAECPQCSARFGAMTHCPFCPGDVKHLELIITDTDLDVGASSPAP